MSRNNKRILRVKSTNQLDHIGSYIGRGGLKAMGLKISASDGRYSLIGRLMGDVRQGRLSLTVVKRPTASDGTYLVGNGPLLVGRCMPLLRAVVTQRETDQTRQ